MVQTYSYLDISDTFLQRAQGEIVQMGNQPLVAFDPDRVQPRSIKALKRRFALPLVDNPSIKELSNALNAAAIPGYTIHALERITSQQLRSPRWCNLNILQYRLSGKKLLECPIVLLPGTFVLRSDESLAMAGVQFVGQDRFPVTVGIETLVQPFYHVPV